MLRGLLGLLHLWIVTYARVALVLAIALSIGYPLCRRRVSARTGLLLSVLVGLVGFTALICVLSWLRIFTLASLWLVAAGGAAASARYLIVDVPRWRSRVRGIRADPALVVAIGVLLVVVLGFSLLALYPSTADDANNYHLPLARDLIQHQGLVYDPFVRYSFFPQANESLFALMLMLSPNAIGCAALEYAVLGLIVLLMPLWFASAGRHAAGGLFAGLLLLASPLIIWTGTIPFVDTWTMVFVTAAMLVALDAVARRSPLLPGLALAGLLAGEAAATKYTGGLFAACALGAVLLLSGRSQLRATWLLATLAGAAVVALPWYAWPLHTTGDPVYPFAVGLFGSHHALWTAQELHLQSVAARNADAGVTAVIRRDAHYLLHGGYLPGYGGPPYSWALGIGFLALALPSTWRDRALISVIAAGGLCVLASLFVSADPRYLLPSFGVLAVGAGLGAARILTLLARQLKAARRAWAITTTAGAAAGLACLSPSLVYAHNVRHANGWPPTSPTEIEAYLDRSVPCYTAIVYLNRHAGSTYRAWSPPACERSRFYARGRLIGDVFSAGSVFRIFGSTQTTVPSEATLWQRLEPLHVQWLVLPSGNLTNPHALQHAQRFALVGTFTGIEVFRIRTRGRFRTS
jgi:Dolichyl-phosphate-mannose-protein mannosyltransferase